MIESLGGIDDTIDCCSSMDGAIEKKFLFDGNNTTHDVKSNEKTYGATPPIDGEAFNIKRSYQLRESTLRKLIELKGVNPDVNVHLNTIIDMAINNLYDSIKIGKNF